MRERSRHGHLVRVWTRVNHRRTSRGNRELVAAYLNSDDGFLADFAALDPERRWLALEAVAAAMERFRPPTTAPVGRIKWKSSPEWQEGIRDAARRLPDDKTRARTWTGRRRREDGAPLVRGAAAGQTPHRPDCRLGRP
jgi:hypothetical protein